MVEWRSGIRGKGWGNKCKNMGPESIKRDIASWRHLGGKWYHDLPPDGLALPLALKQGASQWAIWKGNALWKRRIVSAWLGWINYHPNIHVSMWFPEPTFRDWALVLDGIVKKLKDENVLWSWFERWLESCIYLSKLVEFYPWKECILVCVLETQ